MANTIKLKRYEKDEFNQVVKNKDKIVVFKAINPKKFLQRIYKLDIMSFAEENEIFAVIIEEIVDLFMLEYIIKDFDKTIDGLQSPNQVCAALFDEIMIDENVEYVGSSLTFKQGKAIQKASKIFDMHHEALLMDLTTQKMDCLEILNSGPEKKLFDQSTDNLLKTTTRIDTLIEAYNQSREVLFVNMPGILTRISDKVHKLSEATPDNNEFMQ